MLTDPTKYLSAAPLLTRTMADATNFGETTCRTQFVCPPDHQHDNFGDRSPTVTYKMGMPTVYFVPCLTNSYSLVPSRDLNSSGSSTTDLGRSSTPKSDGTVTPSLFTPRGSRTMLLNNDVIAAMLSACPVSVAEDDSEIALLGRKNHIV